MQCVKSTMKERRQGGRLLDGWMDGRAQERRDGQADERMDESMDEWMNG